MFASPVTGITATSAYVDVFLACAAFGTFYFVTIWKEVPRLLNAFAVGIAAGFCYGIKYTGAVAVIYAACAIAWHLRPSRKLIAKHIALLALGATLTIAPWSIKNAIWLQNPVSPFFNSLFRNPNVHISFERDYTGNMRKFGGVERFAEIPLEVTVRGFRLSGLLGPVFLLAPLGLLALAHRRYRPLAIAAIVFLATYPANIGTRFLLPAVPFLSLALCSVLGRWSVIIGALVLLHAGLSWPTVVERYASEYAWRLPSKWPIEAALRLESESDYLGRTQPRYVVARMLDRVLPPEAIVLAFDQVAQAYTSRSVLVWYQGALNELLTDFLRLAEFETDGSGRRTCFAFPPVELERVRIEQKTPKSGDQWSINELELLHAGQAISGGMQATSYPNPWDAGLALDRSLATRWRTWEPLRKGMYYDVRLSEAAVIDRVCTVSTTDQYHSRTSLYGSAPGERLRILAEGPAESTVMAVPDLRREAMAQLKARGITHLLVHDSDREASEFRDHAKIWGITLQAEVSGARLYRILDGAGAIDPAIQ